MRSAASVQGAPNGAGDAPPWRVSAATPDPVGDSPPWAGGPNGPDDWEARDAVADRDDDVLDEAGETHTELLQRRLGAEIIAEEETGA